VGSERNTAEVSERFWDLIGRPGLRGPERKAALEEEPERKTAEVSERF
jgi:hypothetical protein